MCGGYKSPSQSVCVTLLSISDLMKVSIFWGRHVSSFQQTWMHGLHIEMLWSGKFGYIESKTGSVDLKEKMKRFTRKVLNSSLRLRWANWNIKKSGWSKKGLTCVIKKYRNRGRQQTRDFSIYVTKKMCPSDVKCDCP